ncbi:flavin oxidoreductase [Photobacterium angustum]|uniref:Flavin reductase family protein n=1 Tax=Photobacterium angustum TaxID=661 RepID=A0ABX5H7S9_PHOAN|nr:flavin reductase family protein [Photobacterium angustum]KJG36342.1 flavin oxidoreductase [Photobacterium angustum]PSX12176.1 flavin reductase family protein [Photobacterium angustum]
MDNIRLSSCDIQTMEKRQKVQLINSLPGFKSANLIGTTDKDGNENLAIVSSVIHLGSSPALLGFILRPDTVERHTYTNIQQTEQYTINAVSEEFYQRAHQTSARYPKEVSEFNETGLTPFYDNHFDAPFVLESPIKIGLRLVEIIPIRSNGTHMIIGEIERVILPKYALRKDGYINIESLDLMTLSGLDNYHVTQSVGRLSYAKPEKPIVPLDIDGNTFFIKE